MEFAFFRIYLWKLWALKFSKKFYWKISLNKLYPSLSFSLILLTSFTSYLGILFPAFSSPTCSPQTIIYPITHGKNLAILMGKYKIFNLNLMSQFEDDQKIPYGKLLFIKRGEEGRILEGTQAEAHSVQANSLQYSFYDQNQQEMILVRLKGLELTKESTQKEINTEIKNSRQYQLEGLQILDKKGKILCNLKSRKNSWQELKNHHKFAHKIDHFFP